VVQIALAHLDARKLCPVEIGPRHLKHLPAGVDADGALIDRREQFQQASGAGAEIEHGLDRPLADHGAHRRLDPAFIHMQGAQFVPRRRVLGEIAGGLLRSALAHRFQPLAIARQLRVARIDAIQQIVDHARGKSLLRRAEEGPRPFLIALQQAGLRQQAQMPRDARLRLAQDLDEVGDGQIGGRKQQQQTQARLFARGAQQVHRFIQRQLRAGQHRHLQIR